MPINVYTGLMRSGKSYEVVSQVILNAIAQGRRVVTNVDGVSNELIREYVATNNKIEIDKLGTVVHVKNEDVFDEEFFPYYDDKKGEHIDTLVKPGDLVCVDEAWRFWGGDCKIHKNHKSFFLEHGHFTHPETHVACDLVLMIQDMTTLHRFLRTVIAFSFKTHKKVALGMGGTYSVTMWEGSRQMRSGIIGNWTRRYKKEIFPLYSSFKGGVEGKTVNVDARQNIFMSKKLWIMGIAVIGAATLGAYNVYKFFNPVDKKAKTAEISKTEKPQAAYTGPGSVQTTQKAKTVTYSTEMRYAGKVEINGTAYSIVENENGKIMLESPSLFRNSGLSTRGTVDDQIVTTFSGRIAQNNSNSNNPPAQTKKKND